MKNNIKSYTIIIMFNKNQITSAIIGLLVGWFIFIQLNNMKKIIIINSE